MKKLNCYRFCLFLLLNLFPFSLFAWNHSIELGYGASNDPNHPQYKNSGYLLTSDLIALRRTPCTFWSINGALGRWHTTTPINKNLTTAALALALRYYPFSNLRYFPPYLLGSVGPAYLSSAKFGRNTQAGRLTFQWNAGLGVEMHRWDLNLRFAHFSNAYLAKPDHGFSVLYMLSLGYLWG